MLVEFLVKRSPLSLGASSGARAGLRNEIQKRARREWSGPPHTNMGVQLTIVYLCHTEDVNVTDVDNLIKRIQDALVGLLYEDDRLVTDVDAHRRSYRLAHDLTNWPKMLVRAYAWQEECFYVRVRLAGGLGEML